MAQDIFLRLTGIAGESMDASHSNEIEVLTWHWSVSQQSNMHMGSGGGAGRCTVDDLTFEHYIDRATPNLVQYCLTGKHIEHAVLVMRKAGGAPLEYLTITMEDVLITQVKPVSNANMRVPREEVRLSFARVRQEYVIQNSRGGNAGAVSMGYDIKANKAI
ncbi:Hcp family type VI secretion system effector [Burkholderia ubonensis]|uniref:Hcp1 family type VI secretion system effector n=1 Tax=Burkholderia ubonensis TaxID=101571 RepID=A0ABD6Q837_9BURK|nr:type VI secretion system tube protein Hcp [Burkholderia ubonensis]KVN85514.1 Hcp1 family type VI secretion system effector [Burkholderia ubonensis]KVO04607.1 Hcp1 family type VI secretion system effector [Burkholderia ubonensis]KVO24476.1 Hcp1 family type VI secretion system effector [Burkholderia ubonensis]KVP60601.1 Hcp1 family type VI secretion system effector [Burkholderia ubonensis]KVR02850.1 Hcp1 family type VI secretion system effector [Burkholderia ubonensis]